MAQSFSRSSWRLPARRTSRSNWTICKDMVPRDAHADLLDALAIQPAVAMIGPRQCGKTSLALAVADERDAVYLDLEDRDDRNRLAEPVLFLDKCRGSPGHPR